MTAEDSPKALLSLDGGGMRGAFTLGVLGELESMLAHETGRGDGFVLADFFDYIGGTSTGAIIATGLSLGWSVSRLQDLYRDLGRKVFRQRKFPPLRIWSKYPGAPLHDQLEREFGDRTFGDQDLRTLLMIVMHNRSTDSPYPMSNNPRAVYNTGESPTRSNLNQRLCDLLWASTAAPAFFPPVGLDFGAGEQEFVDGGVTAHNNPALQLFLAATLPEYRLSWPTGEDHLLLVSIGTGFSPARLKKLSRLRRHIIYVATNTPTGLMFAAANHNDVVCRSLADVRFGRPIDRELERLTKGLPIKMFSYARYNVELSATELEHYGVTADPRQLARLDAVEHVDTLMELGSTYARSQPAPRPLRRLHPASPSVTGWSDS